MNEHIELMTLGNLANSLAQPIDAIIEALYRLLEADHGSDRWAIINPGCSREELDATEQRVKHKLHPLHRHLLKLSNGGTIPFVYSISRLAAAISRERDWHILGPFLTPEERSASPYFTARQVQPINPLVIGDPVDFDGVVPDDKYHIGDIIVVADGFGAQQWGYARSEPHRVDCVLPGIGAHIEASDFEQFIKNQALRDECSSPEFRDKLIGAIRQ